jgi:hypothetical protein
MNKIKNRKLKLIATAAILLYALVSYFSGGKCIILTVTGIPCLGCGMTRALLALLQFRFADAFRYHLMVWSLPFLYLAFLLDGKLFRNKALNTLFYLTIFAGFLLNWARNLLDL